MVGRVHREHVTCELRTRQTFGDDGGPGRQGGVHVLGEPRVVERGHGLLVADHQPGVVPVGQCHRMDGTQPAHLANSGNGSSRSNDPHDASASVVVIWSPRGSENGAGPFTHALRVGPQQSASPQHPLWLLISSLSIGR